MNSSAARCTLDPLPVGRMWTVGKVAEARLGEHGIEEALHGRAFVQARAGLGCCTPEIGRRVDINAELGERAIEALRSVPADPAWSQPRSVIVDYGGGAVSALCVDGVSWDVTLLVPGQARHLRRACDDAEVGSIASERVPQRIARYTPDLLDQLRVFLSQRQIQPAIAEWLRDLRGRSYIEFREPPQ